MNEPLYLCYYYYYEDPPLYCDGFLVILRRRSNLVFLWGVHQRHNGIPSTLAEAFECVCFDAHVIFRFAPFVLAR